MAASYCIGRYPRSQHTSLLTSSTDNTATTCDIDHYDAVSTQPSTTTTSAKHADRCSSTPAVCNSLPITVVNSDSVDVLKSRLKTFLFSRALSSRFPVAHCLDPAPLKTRPYGAIQNTFIIIIIIIINIIIIEHNVICCKCAYFRL